MTEKEIDKQLNDELLSFYNKKYEGNMVPNAIELFKKAIWCAPVISHQIHVSKLREIFSKKEEDLLVGEVGMVLNSIVAAPPEKLYNNVEDFFHTQGQIDTIFISYNQKVDEVKNKIGRKRYSLMNLSGARTSPLIKV